jgi:hypothetical protein
MWTLQPRALAALRTSKPSEANVGERTYGRVNSSVQAAHIAGYALAEGLVRTAPVLSKG